MKPNAALDECRGILRRSGSTFALAFRLLPAQQRDAMTAFYAFCRQLDDAVDGVADRKAARAALGAWRLRLERLPERPDRDGVSQALAWSMRRFAMDRCHLELVLEGVERDLEVDRYRRFEDLYEYCYRVASAVGLVCVSVLGPRTPQVELYAELTGIAVQLTNIIRDVREDARRGRIYLPQEDMQDFGVREEDLLGGGEKLRRLLDFEARRCRLYYLMAEAALEPRWKHRLFFAEALRATYRRLLEKLELDGFPQERRTSLGRLEKLAVALRYRLHPATWLGNSWPREGGGTCRVT